MPRAVRGNARAVPMPILAVAVVALLGGCAAPGCRNTVAHRVASPDLQNDAVVYQRDCGGHDGASSGVAIITHDGDLPDVPTSVLTLAQPVDVTATWTSATELRLAYPASATVIGKMATSPEGVRLRLEPR